MHPLPRTDTNDLHPGITDLQAIDEVNRGNREMFEVLVRRYNGLLFRVGLSYLRQREPTEDAMQNAYLKAFLHLRGFRRGAAFSTWLTRIMINECLMVLRRTRTFREEPLLEETIPQETAGPQGAAKMNLKDMKLLLEKAVGALPRNLRTVYMLREVQQMTTAETAESMGISTGSVKVLLHRAREKLKTALLNSAAGLELFDYRAEYCDPMTARVMQAVLKTR